jgi:hypothetical protein
VRPVDALTMAGDFLFARKFSRFVLFYSKDFSCLLFFACYGVSMNLEKKTFFLFGLKRKRFVEWLADIRAEQPGISEFYLMAKLLAKVFLYSRPLGVKRRVYFHRLRVCYNCPVFDSKLKRCRNGEDGCGCYVPFKALAPVDCWLREQGKAAGWGLSDYCGNEKPLALPIAFIEHD